MGYDHWMTPPAEIELVRDYMGRINIDPASNFVAQEYVQADAYAYDYKDELNIYNSTPKYGVPHIDGLSMRWVGNIWLNPPYSAGLIDRFADKAIEEWNFEYPNSAYGPKHWAVNRMLILVNSQTDTGWYHKLMGAATRVFLYRGRLKYWKIFDGKAHPKWEGEKSKAEGKGKIGNSPRYLNTLFLFERDSSRLKLFKELYGHKGQILIPER